MRLFYTDHFGLPLPAGHRFPMPKYALLRERMASEEGFPAEAFAAPEAASDREITRGHCPDYLARVASGTLEPEMMKAIGFPWSERMVERSRRSSGATIAAAREALTRGWSANLAGGTHHAFRDRGEGFCVFNDAAIAARAMQAEAGLRRVAIVDCDVHQGNGTAAIFADDESVFTFSIHAERNFPFRKERSDLDIGLEDGTGDDEYLWHLERGLGEALERARPEFVIYLAGADPYEDDRLGRLKLTKGGLERRDALVLGTLHGRGIPVAIAMAGGYARRIEDSVDIHKTTLVTARRIWAA